MTFDDLYGAGSWTEYQGLMPTAGGHQLTLTQTPIANGVRVQAEYRRQGERSGVVKADHYATRVVWVSHVAPAAGHLSALISRLGPWYVGKGVRDMWMSPAGELSVQHSSAGFVLQPDGRALLRL